MRRDLFTEDHEAFRRLARDFVDKEVVPAYRGAGVADHRYNVILPYFLHLPTRSSVRAGSPGWWQAPC